MGHGFLLDTNTVIYYLGGALQPQGQLIVNKALNSGIKISIISKIELLAWNPSTSVDLKPLIKFVDAAEIYNLTESIGEVVIGIRRNFKKIKLPDAIIAATALYHHLISLSSREIWKTSRRSRDSKSLTPFNIPRWQ